MAIEQLDPKEVGEAASYSADFTGELGGDTISSPTADGVPAGLTVNNLAASSGVVSFLVSGGNAGESYAFVLQVTTTGGQTLRRTVHLPVVASR